MKKVLMVLVIGLLGMSLIAQTQSEVKYNDLSKDIQKYVAKNYDGWAPAKAIVGQDAKGKATYCDVYVSKGTEKLKLVFDKDGVFVKEEAIIEQPEAVAPAPAAVPATAPAPAAASVPATSPTVVSSALETKPIDTTKIIK